MFGSSNTGKDANKPAKGNTAPTPSSNAFNTLVTGTSVEGTIKADSDIRVDGTIKGKLFCDAKVIIGPTGAIEGEIRCQNAVVEGKFEGVLTVSELLNVRETAQIKGDVTTGKLIVQSGAVFNVTCTMTGDKPVSSLSQGNASKSAGKPAEV